MKGDFNTLAQSGTGKTVKNPVAVHGNGSEMTSEKVKENRARKKALAQLMALNFIDIIKELNGDTKGLWNTYHCLGKIITSNGRLYGRYCKNRFCVNCQSIRKAKIINAYMPIIKEWDKPYFVTLTTKAVHAHELEARVDEMIEKLQRIISKHRKRSQRGNTAKLMGIRSLEINFNPLKQWYNPHFHIIVPDKKTAELIRIEWRKQWNPFITGMSAQHIMAIPDKEKALIELVKYCAKVYTELNVLVKKREDKGERTIYIAALDVIFRSLQGHRLFERFGFNLPKSIEPAAKNITILPDYEQWEFERKKTDWINIRNNDAYSGYKPPTELKELFEKRIDKKLK